jgi:hypothetical protein
MASRCSQVSVSRAEIEVGRTPPRSVRCKRTKKSPVAVRHLYPNLGTDGAVRCAGLRVSSALRTQITFSSTLPGIHGYLWRGDWFPIEPKRSLGKPLAFAVGSYPTCTNCNWVFLLMGVANCKNDPAYHVTVEYRGDSTWDSEDFRLDVLSSDAILSSRIFTARKHPASPTNLEHDWLWILHELARGKDAAKLTRKLTSRRIDKRNSLYHSPRTTDLASARLRFGKSISIDDVVILLEGRRRLGIPLALCRARAREPTSYRRAVGGIILRSISSQSKTVLRTGRIVTLHPFEGAAERCGALQSDRFRMNDLRL